MAKYIKRITSCIVALFITVAVFVTAKPISAEAASYNTGTRHELCTTLSAQAVSYYTGEYSWDSMSVLNGGTQDCLNMNNDLFKKLNKLMSSTMTNSVSYSSLTGYWEDTDGKGSKSTTTLFYSDETGDSSYNREHVWPKSHASFHQSNGGSDLHHLRPTNSRVNSTRSNYTMGNVRNKVSGYKTCSYESKPVLYYTTSGIGGSDGLCEVNDNIKGDVARILLYVWCRWEEPNLFKNAPNPVLGPGDKQNDGIKVIESLDTLLEWCAMDPVDTWEMSRNDLTQNIQGNRNVFIDYPEYAWLVFGKDVPENIDTPTNHGGTGGKPGGDSEDPNPPIIDPVVDEYEIAAMPEAGVAYKLRCDKSTPVYFGGEIYKSGMPWYLNLVDSADSAPDVYVEPTASGKYKLYFKKSGGAKTYVCMYQATGRTDASMCISDGTNCQSGCTHDTEYSWNETYKTFVAEVAGSEYYFGTSDKYTSISASAIARAAESGNYPVHLYSKKAGGGEQHEHSFTTEVIAPTCTERGYTLQTCECGEVRKTDYVNATGHKDADKDEVCDICGASLACAHEFKSKVTKPSCLKGGYTTHTCTKCDYSYTDGETAALGHSFGDWSDKVINGKRVRTCSGCGLVEYKTEQKGVGCRSAVSDVCTVVVILSVISAFAVIAKKKKA